MNQEFMRKKSVGKRTQEQRNQQDKEFEIDAKRNIIDQFGLKQQIDLREKMNSDQFQ